MLWFGWGGLYCTLISALMLPAALVLSSALFYFPSFSVNFTLLCNVMDQVSQEPWGSLDHKLVIRTTGVALDEISIC